MNTGKVITIMKAAGLSTDDYDKIQEKAFGSSKPSLEDTPSELLVHSAGQCGDKLRVVNICESAEAFQQLLDETIRPAMEEVGVAGTKPKVRELHNLYIGGAAKPGSTAVNMHIKGATVEQYDAAAEDLFGGLDMTGVAPQGLLVHACAPTDEGLWIFDIWQDEQSFQRFATERLSAASAKAGLPEATPKIYPLYNVRVRARVNEPALS
jgi:hypothetical protein